MGLSPKKNVKITANAAPMADAGKRIKAFLMESAAVGSMVTMAVITANIAGQFNISQMMVVANTARPVLKILPPTNFFINQEHLKNLVFIEDYITFAKIASNKIISIYFFKGGQMLFHWGNTFLVLLV